MNTVKLIAGLAAGAGLTYMLDPDRGRRRRGLARDKLVRAANKTARAVGPTAADVRNRAYGTFAAARSSFRTDYDVSDATLEARVRSELGRMVSHPRAVEVVASDGCVTLRGPILEVEAGRLRRAVPRIRGVRQVDDRLDVHDAADVPALQGGTLREPRMDFWQDQWSPTTRLLSTLMGTALGLYGANRRDARGAALSVLGFGLLARAATNLDTKRLTGAGAGPRAVDVHKTIHVGAPVAHVFEQWSNYENFPRFMSNVREVRDLGEGRSHWVVAGPAGVSVEWDAVVTEYMPNELIAWKSEDGAAVAQTGTVRFEPHHGGTRVTIHLSYNPPAGAFGHAVAKLFGADPKAEMDADLARMKTFLETGRPPHDAARPIM